MKLYAPSGAMQSRTAMVLIGSMVAILAAVWAFQYAGYAPCQLCLEQRKPYYLAIPILLSGALLAWLTGQGPWLRAGLLITSLCLVTTAVIASYHAGVEWSWFEAPASCGAGLSAQTSDASSLLESLASSVPPKCDEAAGRFMGLSFAGWNVVAAVPLAWMAAYAAFAEPN